MSKVIKKCEGRNLAHIVEYEGRYYYVDTKTIPFSKLMTGETMCETVAYECDETGEVYDWWKEVLCHRYNSNEFKEWHDVVIHQLETFITKEADNEQNN